MPEGTRLRRFWILYLLWITGCAVLFLVMQAIEMEDPSRRRDRIPSEVAGDTALRLLRKRDPDRFARFEVVNVAWAREKEVAPDPRWIVLLDGAVRTGLDETVVVELDPQGKPIRMREVFR